ncbi:hypothetical protein [Halospina sp. K52047b]|uniref:hypothetical protein n=1 Tax=Halospina sp. K52047b TaxID=2614160 RepID=UPI00124AC31D|nr:hypothetical protein [Halospina sp. K52047b]KAA8984567.1 hypothetical protein F3089_04270 [Halospina sp. K52047b]
MSGRIHVLARTPGHPRHHRCLAMLGPEDTLVLTAAALERLSQNEPLDGIQAGRIMALTESPENLTLPPGCTALTHAAFVEQILTIHQPVFW